MKTNAKMAHHVNFDNLVLSCLIFFTILNTFNTLKGLQISDPIPLNQSCKIFTPLWGGMNPTLHGRMPRKVDKFEETNLTKVRFGAYEI